MPFTLKIVSGADAGQEFKFDGDEAKLGRVAENNVVIKDGSASRYHARVFEENGAVFVEDLKSANGTILNGAGIKSAKPLKSGDTITIGDVNVEVTVSASNATLMQDPTSTMNDGEGEEAEEPIDPNATLLKPPPSKQLAPKSRPSGIRKKEPEPLQDAAGAETGDFKVPPPKALAARQSGRMSKESPATAAEVEMTAAERLRQRRALEKSASGRAMLMWNSLTKPARVVIGGLGGMLALIAVGTLIYSVIPKSTGPVKAEPKKLVPNGAPIEDSFGVGEGVTFEDVDQKSFDFVTEAASRVVGVIHFQAHDISTNEVMVSLNGADLGPVAADVVDATRELTMVVPASQLKAKETNTITFDSVGNPPAAEPWQVSNIWLEIIPVPEMNAEEAGAQARAQMQRAEKAYSEKDIGASNLFRAWKTYRDAWLLLEATPDRPQDLLTQARTQMTKIRPELDNKCNALSIDYTRAETQNDWKHARAVLEDIPNYFPTREHPCFNMAKGAMKALDGL